MRCTCCGHPTLHGGRTTRASTATVGEVSEGSGDSAGILSVTSMRRLLGTVVQVRLHSTHGDPDDAVAAGVFAEIERLEQVFSVYRPESELSRWRADPFHTPVGSELRSVLALAEHWFLRGNGAFNPNLGALTASWRAAGEQGREPDAATVERLVAEAARLPYAVVDDSVQVLGSCTGIDLNAFAKGWIVDRAVEWALHQPGVLGATVNAGGDLAHRGAGWLRVGVEDPANRYDNGAPLMVMRLANRAIATSGSTRRGVQIGERWFGHVLDPRVGRPVETVVQVSVLADDAATADVVATIVGVETREVAETFVASLDGVGVCVVGASGALWANPWWEAHEVGGEGQPATA